MIEKLFEMVSENLFTNQNPEGKNISAMGSNIIIVETKGMPERKFTFDYAVKISGPLPMAKVYRILKEIIQEPTVQEIVVPVKED